MVDSVLSALDLSTDDQIIIIRENNLAEANFIFASILSKCVKNENNICFVTLHNTFSHYHNIGKHLNYDLMDYVKKGHMKTIEPLNEIAEEILKTEGNKYLTKNSEAIAKQLFLDIHNIKNEFLKNNKQTFVIIDDISHLLELGLSFKLITNFIQNLFCLTNNKYVSLVLNCHVATKIDDLISNTMLHSADLCITVSSLKTGRSRNVSGIFTVTRNNVVRNDLNKQRIYHYKLFDKEIRVFAPGTAII